MIIRKSQKRWKNTNPLCFNRAPSEMEIPTNKGEKMLIQDNYQDAHEQFGINEVYIIEGLDEATLKKLQLRAELTLDGNDTVVKNHASYDMLFIFHKRVTSKSFMYRFLEFLQKNPSKEKDFRKLYELINPEEILESVQGKKYVLVSTRDLS